MHIRIPVQVLTHALTLAQAGGPGARNVSITASLDGVQLERSDGFLAICIHLPEAHVLEEGQLLVPSRQLQEVLRQCGTASRVELAASLGEVILAASDLRVTLPGEDPTPFPSMATRLTMPRSWEATVEAPALRRGLEQVLFSAAREGSHPAFQGVLCQFEVPVPGQLTLVACNQFRMAIHRMAIHTFPCSPVDAGQEGRREHQGPEAAPQLLVPAASLKALQRVLPRQGEVTIGGWPHGVLFQAGPCQLFSCLLPETFPDYRKVLPTEQRMRAVLEVGPFLRRLQAARALARERANGVWLRFGGAAGEACQRDQVGITVGRPASEDVVYTSTLEGTVEGEDLTLLLNIEYLLDFLKRLPLPAVVEITGTTPNRPLVFTWGAPGRTLTYLVMPMLPER